MIENKTLIEKVQKAFKEMEEFEIKLTMKERIMLFLGKTAVFFREGVFRKKGEITFHPSMIRVDEYVKEGLRKTTLYRINYDLDDLKSLIDSINMSIRKREFKIKQIKFLKLYYFIQIEYFDEKKWKEECEKAKKEGKVITIPIGD